MDQELCPALVRKNLVLVELGKDLTVPLARLQRNCDFKREWDKIQDKWHGDTKEEILRKARNKQKWREYSQRPEVKEKRREYYQRNKDSIKKARTYER